MLESHHLSGVGTIPGVIDDGPENWVFSGNWINTLRLILPVASGYTFRLQTHQIALILRFYDGTEEV